MTISTTTRRNQYLGTGITGPYPYSFRIVAATDLVVTTRDLNDTEATLAYPADYSVTGVGDASGSITLTNALPANYTLTIRRVRPLLQTTDLRNQGTFFPEVHEDAFDNQTMVSQQQQDELDRSLKYPTTVDPNSVTADLPVPESFKVLGWNSTGNAIANYTLDANAVAVPGGGRTVSTLSAYLANNALFNVKDYGAVGNNSADDTTAIQAAIAAAGVVAVSGSFGATVVFPPGTYLVSTQLTVPAGVALVGAGSRATRLKSSVAGFALKIGTTGASLAYGCGVRDLSAQMTNTAGGAIWAIGTCDFFARDLYIEGVVSGGCTGIFLDGGAAANLFTRIDNVDCNHVKYGLHLGTTGAQTTTSVDSVGFRSLGDLVAGSVGILVDATHGNGSRFIGGNLEDCATGVSVAGFGCRFMGVRFEANTAAAILQSGAQANVFTGCIGWTAGTVTDNSGNSTNSFLANKASDYSHYPNDTLGTLSSGITFGPDASSLKNLTALAIANNATGTTPSSPCSEFLLYDSGATANAAKVLVTASSGGTLVTIIAQNGSTFTTTPGTGGKLNLSVGGGNLSIENKLGSNTTIHLLQTKLV